MKTFEKDGRINFVDENNLLVGFDNSQSCCESFGHMITRDLPHSTDQESIQIDESKYRFDPTFTREGGVEGLDEGGAVSFRLVNSENCLDCVYLTLYNSHNGYYSKGFHFTNGDTEILSGSL